MKRCESCNARMVYPDGERHVCLLCSHVASDPVDTITKMESNATPEWDDGSSADRVPADIDAIRDRVIAEARRAVLDDGGGMR